VEPGYVWHCHIIDHEDNEMMRPYRVIPSSARTGTAPVALKSVFLVPSSRNINEVVLDQNYPNPFNGETQILFALPEAAKVKLTIYNQTGQLVKELINSEAPAGQNTVRFDAENQSEGIYFYQLKTGDFTKTRKLIIAR